MTTPPRQDSELLLYSAPDGTMKVGVLFRDDTAWLTQKALAELFGVGVPAIAKHLRNIFESGELDPGATVSKMEMVRTEGERQVTCTVEVYNLDAIIAVGQERWVMSPCMIKRRLLMKTEPLVYDLPDPRPLGGGR